MDPNCTDIRLDGKVAIVTGGSRGIGEAIATRFVHSGAKVVIASRKQEGLDAAKARIVAATGAPDAQVLAKACHMGKTADIAALVASTLERFTTIDVLVNNAATNPYFGPMLGIDAGAWDKTFEVNVKGYFEATRAVVSHWSERNSAGTVINVASVNGMIAAPLQGVYAMTKAAVISMTKTLARELGPGGIRINAIAPGLVQTRFAAALVQNDTIREHILERTALGRLGEPHDISAAALFLASDAAAFVTGQTWVVDGGLTLE